MHIAAAVAQRTPLPTVLLRDIASTEARAIEGLSSLSEIFLIKAVMSFKILGKRNARAAY